MVVATYSETVLILNLSLFGLSKIFGTTFNTTMCRSRKSIIREPGEPGVWVVATALTFPETLVSNSFSKNTPNAMTW